MVATSLESECASFERIKELLEYNPFSGKISRKVSQGGQKVGSAAGYLHNDHLRIRVDGKQYYASRIAHLLMTGNWPNKNPEHQNQQGCDNRWSNIKDEAGQHENQGVSGLQANNTSDLRGVTWDKNRKKWVSQIHLYGKNIRLGRFDNKDEAGLVRDAAARLAWTPRFQHLNHPGITAHHIILSDRVLRQIEAAMADEAEVLSIAA
jgi:hypothetical protein